MSDLRSAASFSVGRPHVLEVSAGPDDIDAQGHVSNVVFLAWMNRAAIEHSAALGWDAAAYRRHGAMFVVKRHELDYLRPVHMGERLLAATWVSLIEKATAHRRHEIVRACNGERVARGFNVWAFVETASGRPVRIPPALLAAFDPQQFQ